jgi:hypothetical protein
MRLKRTKLSWDRGGFFLQLSLGLLTLLLVCGNASAKIVALNTKDLCQISVNSVRISDAIVIGEATVMEEFLRDKTVVYIHSCEYWLRTQRITEVQYVMQKFVHPAALTYTVPKYTILIQLAKPTEFLQLASSGLHGPPPSSSQWSAPARTSACLGKQFARGPGKSRKKM